MKKSPAPRERTRCQSADADTPLQGVTFPRRITFHAAPARADIVFDFSGVCDSGCTGTATGVLTLAESYTFGSDLTPASFVSFHYSSSDISFDVPKAAGLLFSGGLNANGSIVGTDLAIVGEHEFGVFPGGEFVVDVTDTGGDKGSTSDFTLVSGGVPEPTTWAMMLLGFAGLSFAKYRKTGGARTRLSVA